jgi:hypothetical protein
MPGSQVRIAPLFMIGGGAIFLWSGLTGKSWSQVLKDVIQGKNPKDIPQTQGIKAQSFTGNAYGYSAGIFPGNPPIGQISGKGNQQIAQGFLNHYGWGPGEMLALVPLWAGESGWSPIARNNSSGAFGIAQALGHGVPGGAAPDGTNEYGGYGLTIAQARRANAGDPVYQIIWGLNYIHQTYGSPSKAWAAWQSRSPHWY